MSKDKTKKKDIKEEQKPEKKFGQAKQEKPKQEQKTKKKIDAETPGIRGIVRLAEKDMPGSLQLKRALLSVKGIGQTLRYQVAKAINGKLKISPETKIGSLSEEQIEDINNILYNMDSKSMPTFLMNRRSAIENGKNTHLVTNDLLFAYRQDTERKKKSRSWQGIRLLKGKKAHGQRTRNTGRHGISMGVLKKKEVPGKPAASTGTEKKSTAPEKK